MAPTPMGPPQYPFGRGRPRQHQPPEKTPYLRYGERNGLDRPALVETRSLPQRSGGHHGEQGMGEEREGYVPLPAVPTPHLVVSQPHLPFGRLETRLYPPALSRDTNQIFEGGSARGEDHIVGEVVGVFDAAPDQQEVLEAPLLLGDLEPEKGQQRPVVEPLSLGARSGRKPAPILLGGSLDEPVGADLGGSSI